MYLIICVLVYSLYVYSMCIIWYTCESQYESFQCVFGFELTSYCSSHVFVDSFQYGLSVIKVIRKAIKPFASGSP